MLCEYCNLQIEEEKLGKYSSGRFCDQVCANSFSSSQNRKERNLKIKHTLQTKTDNILEKKCRKCNKVKKRSAFNKASRRKDGLQAVCKICDRKTSKASYDTNKNNPEFKEKVKQRRASFLKKKREYILEYLKTHPCVCCGEKDPVVLQFDHLGDKFDSVGRLVNRSSFLLVKEEIKKCQVLCANCHARKTAKDFNWYKLEL